MTEKERQASVKDLCARLPYGVICDRLGQAKKLLSASPYKVYCLEFDNGEYMPSEYKVEDIKPYLRPMSSMTEEERADYHFYCETVWDSAEESDYHYDTFKSIDWLNEHHFDYRGLIPMGLALEAPDDMYKQ